MRKVLIFLICLTQVFREYSRFWNSFSSISLVICSGDWTNVSRHWRRWSHQYLTRFRCASCVQIGCLRHPCYSCSSPSPFRFSLKWASLESATLYNVLISSICIWSRISFPYIIKFHDIYFSVKNNNDNNNFVFNLKSWKI